MVGLGQVLGFGGVGWVATLDHQPFCKTSLGLLLQTQEAAGLKVHSVRLSFVVHLISYQRPFLAAVLILCYWDSLSIDLFLWIVSSAQSGRTQAVSSGPV